MPGSPKKITERVIDFAIDELCRCKHKSDIKQGLAEKFGIENPASIEKVFARARARMREAQGSAVAEHVSEAIEYYRGIIRDNGTTVREKLLARERLDKLLGLEIRGGGAGVTEPGMDPKVG